MAKTRVQLVNRALEKLLVVGAGPSQKLRAVD
jgi:hypothetical protein